MAAETKPGAAPRDGGRARRSHDHLRHPDPARPTARPTPPASTTTTEIGDPGRFPYTRGLYPEMYRSRPWTMRQYAGYAERRRVQPPLPLPPRPGHDRPLGRLRPADPDRLRLRPPAGARRGRPRRRGDRLDRRHAPPLRRHPARPRHHLDDDQRHRRDPPRPLPRRRRGAGRALGEGRRHGPERHPQGVRRPRHLHLPARRRRSSW